MSVGVVSVRVVVAAAMFALASTAIVPAAGTLDYDFCVLLSGATPMPWDGSLSR